MRLAFDSIRMNRFASLLLEYYSGPHEVRRLLMHHFPYAVVFVCRPDETLVVAVAHTHRRPLYWLSRLE